MTRLTATGLYSPSQSSGFLRTWIINYRELGEHGRMIGKRAEKEQVNEELRSFSLCSPGSM
jgi:hypothetical protein